MITDSVKLCLHLMKASIQNLPVMKKQQQITSRKRNSEDLRCFTAGVVQSSLEQTDGTIWKPSLDCNLPPMESADDALPPSPAKRRKSSVGIDHRSCDVVGTDLPHAAAAEISTGVTEEIAARDSQAKISSHLSSETMSMNGYAIQTAAASTRTSKPVSRTLISSPTTSIPLVPLVPSRNALGKRYAGHRADIKENFPLHELATDPHMTCLDDVADDEMRFWLYRETLAWRHTTINMFDIYHTLMVSGEKIEEARKELYRINEWRILNAFGRGRRSPSTSGEDNWTDIELQRRRGKDTENDRTVLTPCADTELEIESVRALDELSDGCTEPSIYAADWEESDLE